MQSTTTARTAITIRSTAFVETTESWKLERSLATRTNCTKTQSTERSTSTGYYAGLYDAGELDGTCVWSIGLYSAFYEPDANAIRWAIEQAQMFGEHIYLVRGRCQALYGEEIGEIIVENAYVALKLL